MQEVDAITSRLSLLKAALAPFVHGGMVPLRSSKASLLRSDTDSSLNTISTRDTDSSDDELHTPDDTVARGVQGPFQVKAAVVELVGQDRSGNLVRGAGLGLTSM